MVKKDPNIVNVVFEWPHKHKNSNESKQKWQFSDLSLPPSKNIVLKFIESWRFMTLPPLSLPKGPKSDLRNIWMVPKQNEIAGSHAFTTDFLQLAFFDEITPGSNQLEIVAKPRLQLQHSTEFILQKRERNVDNYNKNKETIPFWTLWPQGRPNILCQRQPNNQWHNW